MLPVLVACLFNNVLSCLWMYGFLIFYRPSFITAKGSSDLLRSCVHPMSNFLGVVGKWSTLFYLRYVFSICNVRNVFICLQ